MSAQINPPNGESRSRPIELKRRRTAFENSRFRVFADHIMDSKGREVDDFLVVVPRNQDSNAVTGVLIIPVQNDHILFLNVFRHPVGRHLLEAPRGFLDEGEEPRQAAARELTEETGLLCAPERFIPLGFIHPASGLLASRIALFAAMGCQEGGCISDREIGIEERFWIPVREAHRMLLLSELEEAATCLGLHRYFMLVDQSRDR